jgi:hypothetical protein
MTKRERFFAERKASKMRKWYFTDCNYPTPWFAAYMMGYRNFPFQVKTFTVGKNK